MVPCAKRLESLIHWQLQNRGLRRRNNLCKKRGQTDVCTKSHREWFEVDINEASQVIRFWVDWINYYKPYRTDGRLREDVIGQWEIRIESARETLERWRQSVPKEYGVWMLAVAETGQIEHETPVPLPILRCVEADALEAQALEALEAEAPEAEVLVTGEPSCSIGDVGPSGDIVTKNSHESELQKVQSSFNATPKTPPNKMFSPSLSASSPSPAVTTPDSTFSKTSIASSATDLSCLADGSPFSQAANLMPTTPTKSRSKSPRRRKGIGAQAGQKARTKSPVPRTPQHTPLGPKELAGDYFAGSSGSSM